MKILIVDDSTAMRRIISRTLRQAGFTGYGIIEAENATVALEKIEREAPMIVLSDMNMPEMSGLDLLKELRARGSQVTFGFITTESNEAFRKAAERAGASFFLEKPFSIDQMELTLQPFLA